MIRLLEGAGFEGFDGFDADDPLVFDAGDPLRRELIDEGELGLDAGLDAGLAASTFHINAMTTSSNTNIIDNFISFLLFPCEFKPKIYFHYCTDMNL
jgi:hypothetical protein